MPAASDSDARLSVQVALLSGTRCDVQGGNSGNSHPEVDHGQYRAGRQIQADGRAGLIVDILHLVPGADACMQDLQSRTFQAHLRPEVIPQLPAHHRPDVYIHNIYIYIQTDRLTD